MGSVPPSLASWGLVLTELHPGVTVDDIRAKTGAPFEVVLTR
jgi:acyl CoA:acetate/3-ketoacid CoA transferase beta subunit